jgi:VWFA-related protein
VSIRLAWTLLFVAAALHAQDRPQFRAGVDLVEVDVVVIDGSGRIVGGLAKEDFELREDGSPVEIKTFVAVTSDDAKTTDEGRLVILLLDNLVTAPAWTTPLKAIAHRFADRMGPYDVMGVAFMNGGAGKTTNSRQQILADIDRFKYEGTKIADLTKHVLDMITELAHQLEPVKHRRKTLVCIGTPSVFNPTEPLGRSGLTYSGNWYGAVKDASRSNVSVYLIDPSGLAPRRPDDALAFTEETGGQAFATNEFDKAVNQVWSEAGRYYLLGYEPPSVGGKSHRIDVRVKRPNVVVRARRTRF